MDTDQFGGDLANRRRLVETSIVAFEAVGNCKRPVIAAVNGPALAGGFALALLCDLRVAHESAVFGYPELPRGIPPSYAAARAVLPATVAQELCLTGRLVERARGAADGHRPRGRRWTTLRAARSSWRPGSPGMPRRAILETKRRTLLERRHLWGFLFEEEHRVFSRALLGENGDPSRTARRPRNPSSGEACSSRRRPDERLPERRDQQHRERDRRPLRTSLQAGHATRHGGSRSSMRPAAGTPPSARASRAGTR